MGCQHFPQAGNAGKHLRENFRSGGDPPDGSPGVDHHRPFCDIDRVAILDDAALEEEPVGLPGFPYVFGYRLFERILSRSASTSAVSPDSVTAILNAISVWSM